MKVRVPEVFKDTDQVRDTIEILRKDYLLRDKKEEMALADFVRVGCSNRSKQKYSRKLKT